MTKIQENIARLRSQLPKQVRLVCVSKFHSEADIMEAYNAGERDFGESRAQELLRKTAVLPKDIRWHFIGSLQTNKVKQVVPLSYLIQSVDSVKLLAAINDFAGKNGLTSKVLLEAHVAQEETKHGFLPSDLMTFFAAEEWKKYPYVQICGLMGMATLDADEAEIRHEFQTLNSLFKQIQTLAPSADFTELSMGMTHDFPLAVDEGSTCVRVGTFIFGERQY